MITPINPVWKCKPTYIFLKIKIIFTKIKIFFIYFGSLWYAGFKNNLKNLKKYYFNIFYYKKYFKK